MINNCPISLKYGLIVILGLYVSNSMLQFLLYSTLLFWGVTKTVLYYKSLPPGPWGVPLLGYLLFMSNKPPHKFYMDMCDRYGDVFSVQLGSNLIVGIGSAKLMRDLFNRTDSTGRPKTPLNSLLGGLGIVTSEGLLWKRQRTFLHEKFRALGVKLCPNEHFEKFVRVEIEEMCTILNETQGRAVNPRLIFGRHIHNVICQLMMNFRFERHDTQFAKFNENVTKGMKLFGLVHMGEHFKPYLHLPGKMAIIKEIKRNLSDVSKFHADHLKNRITERSTTYLSKPKDLLDYYLESVQKQHDHTTDDPQSKNQIFPGVQPDSQIIQTMNDLFSAGMETTLTTLLWCIAMMLREPEVAEKVRKELRQCVSPGHLVTMEHRLSMPYIEAVIFETMRMTSVVPLGTTHVNESDWHVGRYLIPAGSHIVPLINKMNMDAEHYPEPHKFNPDRFIVDGKCHAAKFLQFGVGQRMCLGNMLARMELFLFFANIMNTFVFSLPIGDHVPTLEGVLGVTHAPLPYKVSFTKLKSQLNIHMDQKL